MSDNPTDEVRGFRNLAKILGRDESTVRTYIDQGIPHERDGRVYVFSESEAVAWWSDHFGKRGEDDEDSDEEGGSDNARYRKARTRKLELEGDRLLREKNIEDGLYAPVQVIEDTLFKVLTEMKQTLNELFNEMLDLSDLSPADKEKLQIRLVAEFNKIADQSTTTEER